MRTPARLGLILTPLACFILAGPAWAETTPDRSVAPVDPIEAIIPGNLRTLPLQNPQVVFLVRVDATGKLVEHMALSATHHELIPAAAKALQAAAFTPAMVAGQPVQANGQVRVTLFDPEQRAFLRGNRAQLPYGGSAMDAAQSRLYRADPTHHEYHRSKASELDAPVEVTATKIMLYTDAAGKPAAGRCVVEYWVDAEGGVRFPRVVTSDNEAVSMSALLTLQQTRFAPPTHDGGVPTYVQVRQAMEFDTEPAEAKNPAEA